jgi:hypothetical protein
MVVPDLSQIEDIRILPDRGLQQGFKGDAALSLTCC